MNLVFLANQDPRFLPLTIHEYLKFGFDSLDMEKALTYAIKLNLVKNKTEFSFSYQRVYEEITPLSGGERQRLIILRILLKKPNILFLDEILLHLIKVRKISYSAYKK